MFSDIYWCSYIGALTPFEMELTKDIKKRTDSKYFLIYLIKQVENWLLNLHSG